MPDLVPVSKKRPNPLCLNPRITRITVTYYVTDNKSPDGQDETSRADGFLPETGRTADARASYERPLSLTQQEPERCFLKRRLSELPE